VSVWKCNDVPSHVGLTAAESLLFLRVEALSMIQGGNDSRVLYFEIEDVVTKERLVYGEAN